MTLREAECLKFIEAYWEEHGCSPSYDEIGAAMGLVKSNIHRLVHQLTRNGYLRTQKYTSRSLEPINIAERHIDWCIDNDMSLHDVMLAVGKPLLARHGYTACREELARIWKTL
tara:strand:+ start:509 stop:850 length:342 start_codon:yes stop_codon:yes gene_type:complete